MLEMVIGVIAVIFGLWGIARSWYLVKDIVLALLPLAILSMGTIMLLAGIRGIKKKKEASAKT